MSKKTLLLDKIYQPIAFLNFRRMAKLVMTNRVEVIDIWQNLFLYGNIEYPSIVKLNNYIRKKPIIPRFCFKGVLKRDKYCCQYTGIQLSSSKLTIDHVIPKSQGGKSSWNNCVTATLEINLKKGNRTPEEAGLK
jgi:hypothetical protein